MAVCTRCRARTAPASSPVCETCLWERDDEIAALRRECETWMNGVADAVEPLGYDRETASGPADLLPGLADLVPKVERDRGVAPERMITYRRADGELIAGEYAFVTTLDWFQDHDVHDRLELIEETWTLTRRWDFAIGRLERWCDECDDDVTLTEPVDGPVFCPEHQPSEETR